MPSLGGGSDGLVVVAEGVKDFESGVVGCNGPDGAKENNPDDFEEEPKENFGGSAALAASFADSCVDCVPVIASSSSRASSTILLTELDDFLGEEGRGADAGATGSSAVGCGRGVGSDAACFDVDAAGCAEPFVSASSSMVGGGGCQPAFVEASRRCVSYCESSDGKTVLKSKNSFPLSCWERKVRNDVFSPRREV